MSKVRVYELAASLGVTSRVLLAQLDSMGEYARSASSTLEAPVVRRVRQSYGLGPSEKAVARPSRPVNSLARSEPQASPASRVGGWRSGAVSLPRSQDLIAAIDRLGDRFPAFRDHLDALRALGSQVIFAGFCKQKGFTNCGVALVRFSGAIEAGFGFTRELMIFYSPHNDLQSRCFEVASRELSRTSWSVTPDIFFMWAPDQRLSIKLKDWSKPKRLAIPLEIDPVDEMSLITLLRDHVYARDLFYLTTPVYGANFFGRRTLLQSLRDDVLNQRVSGVFGLRKSGKTSILMQLREELRDDHVVSVLMDLEAFPSPPEDPTDDILADLRRRLIAELKSCRLRTQELSELAERPTILEFKNAFQTLLKRLARNGDRVLLLLDEIEYLTPADQIDIAEGNMPRVSQLLAALRSVVQESDNFTFVLSGLTSAIVEGGRLYGRPNPLFSWARAIYVSPLTREEADNLAETVGAKMGIQIQSGALEALHEASGGHAFLYRNLGSTVVEHLPKDDFQRVMSRAAVLTQIADWKSRVQGSIDEMIQHVKRYYPTEAVMLELLINDPSDFSELAASEHVAVRRLKDLGLIHEVDGSFEPSVVLELR